MHNRLLIALACLCAALLFYTACALHGPDYISAGAVANGPGVLTPSGHATIAWMVEWRVDRWTGLEEQRSVNYGQPTPWHAERWRPLATFGFR